MSELNFYLLQINDALFPIGAYSHSQGLETYIQRGIVHDEATAKEYIHHKIRWNLAFWKRRGFRCNKGRPHGKWGPVLQRRSKS